MFRNERSTPGKTFLWLAFRKHSPSHGSAARRLDRLAEPAAAGAAPGGEDPTRGIGEAAQRWKSVVSWDTTWERPLWTKAVRFT
jgi:hypothetical protein